MTETLGEGGHTELRLMRNRCQDDGAASWNRKKQASHRHHHRVHTERRHRVASALEKPVRVPKRLDDTEPSKRERGPRTAAHSKAGQPRWRARFRDGAFHQKSSTRRTRARLLCQTV